MNDYDRIRYPGRAFVQTHPDRLAAVATLLGLAPAPPARCRVLELGCGNGGNLIPMAAALPEARFLGIDLAARPIADGQAVIAELGLGNIELRACDVMEATALGSFDFIIAHGLYSWVPDAVRERILGLCAAALAPSGVAYISYNAYPGCHVRDLVRGIMRYHVRDLDDPEARIDQAKAIIGFIADAHGEAEEPTLYQRLLGREFERLENVDWRAAVYHDDLSPDNAPCYFHEFVARAARHGLQYLAEADFSEMQERVFPPEVAQRLQELGDDVIAREQYLDFLKGRRFRQTLLVHRAARIERAIAAPRLAGLTIAAPLRATPVAGGDEVEFTGPRNSRLVTAHPLTKAAMHAVAEAWPAALGCEALAAAARRRLGAAEDPASAATAARAVGEVMLAAYSAGLVDLHAGASPMVAVAGPRPRASAYARWQCLRTTEVVNLRHIQLDIADANARRLLPLLDGRRDRAGLLVALAAMTPADEPRPDLVLLEALLGEFARLALLLA